MCVWEVVFGRFTRVVCLPLPLFPGEVKVVRDNRARPGLSPLHAPPHMWIKRECMNVMCEREVGWVDCIV